MSLSSLIVQRDVATMRQVEEALARQVIYGGDLVTNLLETTRVDEAVLTALLAESMHIAAGPAGELPLAAEFVRALVPADFALQAMAVPLDLEQQRMVLAVAEPLAPEMRDRLCEALGMEIEELAAPAVRVWQGLSRTYGIELDRRMQRLISRLSEALAAPAPSAPPGAALRTRRSPASSPSGRLARGDAVAQAQTGVSVPSVAAPSAAPGAALRTRRSPASFPSGPPTVGAVQAQTGLAVRLKAPRHPTLKSFPRMKVSSAPPSPDALPAGSGAAGPVEPLPLAKPSEHHAGVLQRSAGPNIRPTRRRRGPVTIETVRREAEEAGDRDVLLDLYFEFSRQFFDYAALFLVQGDIAEGRDAFGSGASRERVQGIGVPLDMPSMLSTAREKRVPILGSAAADGLDAVLLGDLQRPPGIEVATLPLVVRTRAVALLIGDCAESGIDRDGVQQVLACARLVGKGFERIIVRRKLEGFVAGTLAPADAPPGDVRAEAPGDAHTEAPADAHTEAPADAHTEAPADARAGAPGDAHTEAPADARAGAPGDAPGEIYSPSSFDSRVSAWSPAPSAPPLPAARSLPDLRAAPAETFPSAPSGVSSAFGPVVGGRSPSSFRGPFDTATTTAPPAANIASVRPMAHPSIPREEPGPAAGPAGNDAVWAPASARRALHSPIPREEPEPSAGALPYGAGRSVARSSAPAPGSIRFGANLDSAVRSQGADTTCVARAPVAAQRVRQQRDSDGPVSSVVVPPRHPTAPRVASETSLPTVIIDLEVDLGASVDRVVQGEVDEAAEAELLHHGERAMAVIMQRFPGPVALEWSRLASMTHPPRASECGPILRLVARERKVALPFVLERLTSLDREERGWATYLLAELPYSEAIPKLIDRLRDEDAGIHVAAARAISAVARSFPEQVATELKSLARSSEDKDRSAAVRAMAEVRHSWVVPELIAGLRDSAEDVVTAAHHGLVRVTRQDFGSDGRSWLRWWERNRERHRVEWLVDALTHELPEIRRAAGEELRTVSRQYFGYASDLPPRDRERAQRRYRDWWITERRARQRYP